MPQAGGAKKRAIQSKIQNLKSKVRSGRQVIGKRQETAGGRWRKEEGNPIQNPKSKIQNPKLHHIGIAVSSLEAACPVFERLLGKPSGSEVVEEQKVRVVFFRAGECRLELLEATSEDSPIARFISKRGQGIHHVALSVEDLAGTLRELENAGVRLIDREPRRGAENTRVAFLHPASTAGVLLELVQES